MILRVFSLISTILYLHRKKAKHERYFRQYWMINIFGRSWRSTAEWAESHLHSETLMFPDRSCTTPQEPLFACYTNYFLQVH